MSTGIFSQRASNIDTTLNNAPHFQYKHIYLCFTHRLDTLCIKMHTGTYLYIDMRNFALGFIAFSKPQFNLLSFGTNGSTVTTLVVELSLFVIGYSCHCHVCRRAVKMSGKRISKTSRPINTSVEASSPVVP